MQVVTGAFGYIGRYIARRLLDAGEEVRTVTTHPDRPNPLGRPIDAYPFNFDDPDRLVDALRGASVLYNTYWVRIEHGGATYRQAVRHTETLFACAKRAGVGKVVHISVTNAARESRLPYYRGKALQEQLLVDSGLPHAVVRPTLVFGREDILVNNMAWMVRRFPVFPIFGKGDFRLQPVFVDDLAKIAIASAGTGVSGILDAVGAESYTFEGFIRLLVSELKSTTKLVRMPPSLGIALGRLLGLGLRDVVLTRAELQGLMDGMLTSDQAPNAPTAFSDWLARNKDNVGTSYTSELGRHYRWRRTG